MRLAHLGLIVLLSLSSFTAAAERYEIDESTWQGDAIHDLRVEGEPDDRGLVWMTTTPRRALDPWFAWVYNSSDTPVFGIKVSLWVEVRGQWYLPSTRAANKMVWPYQINPGSIGIVDLGTVSRTQSPWTDQKIEVVDADEEHKQYWSLLTLKDFRVSNGEVRGILVNEGRRPLSQFGPRFACVENGEITGITWHKSDLVALYPDESEPFTFKAKLECDQDDWIYFGYGSAT